MYRVAGQIHRGSYLGECRGRVSGWEVSEEKTLSDLYILMDVAMGGPSRTRAPGRPPRGGGGRMKSLQWGSTHRDKDFMAAAAIVVA